MKLIIKPPRTSTSSYQLHGGSCPAQLRGNKNKLLGRTEKSHPKKIKMRLLRHQAKGKEENYSHSHD